MSYNEKQKEYSVNYAKTNLKRIPLDVKKDYYEDVIVKAAEESGMSIRSFILSAIKEKISRNA